jgi:hypothetical protein
MDFGDLQPLFLDYLTKKEWRWTVILPAGRRGSGLYKTFKEMGGLDGGNSMADE